MAVFEHSILLPVAGFSYLCQQHLRLLMWCKTILETIGNTPMVQLNRVAAGLPATVLAKVETFNPGNSIKDRMALKMIEDAEANGRLKPGGTIIEGTSGNTGMGLAIAAIIKGYKCIFTTTDKQSQEKIDALRALGAEVIVCPTNVEPEDPRSYYSVSSRLVAEVPNAWKPNQYDNLSNSQAHYESTGPEIWEQTEGKITHLVVGVGTGGTISGTARYLKEKNPNVQIWGIDTYGSVFKKYHETGEFDKKEIYPYITEGIGEDFLPENVDFSLIDRFEKVSDKDAAIYTREIARNEGIFAGNSAGAAVAGLLQLKHLLKEGDVVVVIFHDHGIRYLGKMFNDNWMRDRGFLDRKQLTVKDLLVSGVLAKAITVPVGQTTSEVVQLMQMQGISQVPVVDGNRLVGALTDSRLFGFLVQKPESHDTPIAEIMEKPFPVISADCELNQVGKEFSKETHAVLVKDGMGEYYIMTRTDLLTQLIG
jgi:cystathionine beta-synthase